MVKVQNSLHDYEIRLNYGCCGCSVTKSCPTLCNLVNCSTPAFSVLHYFCEFAQTYVHWVSDAIQPYHPLSFPFLPASIFPSITVFFSVLVLCIRWQNIGASAPASVLPMNIQSWFPLGLTDLISLLSKGLSRVFSSTCGNMLCFLGA